MRQTRKSRKRPIHTCNVYLVVSNSLEHMHCSYPGSSVCGIFQARILKQIAISYSRGSSWPRSWTHVSCVFCVGRQILYHCNTWEASYVYGHYSQEKRVLFPANGAGTIIWSKWPKNKFGSCLRSYTKINKKDHSLKYES